MKKIFNNRNEPNEVINTANYTIGQNYSHFIGRTFQLDKHVVTVDDVIDHMLPEDWRESTDTATEFTHGS